MCIYTSIMSKSLIAMTRSKAGTSIVYNYNSDAVIYIAFNLLIKDMSSSEHLPQESPKRNVQRLEPHIRKEDVKL